MARQMKNSGVEWIGEIPADWKVEKNKHLFVLRKNIVGENFVKYNLLSLTKKGIVIKSIEDCFGKTPESYNTYQSVEHGQIVMCLFDLDMSAVFSGLSYFNGMISPAYKVYDCKNNIVNEFAKYWFAFCFDGRKYKMYSKSLRYVVNADDFGDIPIILPKENEQQKIAEFLDEKVGEIDSVIVKTKETIEDYKKYKQAIITDAVTKGLNLDVEMKESGIKWIGMVPIQWRIIRIKNIAEEIGDGLHSTPAYDENGDVYFINGNNIGDEHLTIKSDTNRLNVVEQKRYKLPLLNDNTIMIALNGATYGKTSFYNGEKVLLGKSAGYITLNKMINKKYIRYFLQSFSAKYFMTLSLNGTTIQNLSLNTLNNFYITFPKGNEQQEIVDYLDEKCFEIDKLIAKKEELLADLESYKKSLIYEYVTGKKEVE